MAHLLQWREELSVLPSEKRPGTWERSVYFPGLMTGNYWAPGGEMDPPDPRSDSNPKGSDPLKCNGSRHVAWAV